MGIALFAGFLSCASPCTLPLVPAYLGYISGVSADRLQAEMPGAVRRQVLFNAVAFVLGLSVVFTLLGASASALGHFLQVYQDWLARIGGLLIVIFGLHMLGVLKIGFLAREARLDFGTRPAPGYAGSVIMGAAFGVGWTPCVGPFLGAILTMAAQTQSLGAGMLLLFIYALGMGVPFIAAGLAIGSLSEMLRWLRRHADRLSVVSGVLVIAMGLLVFSGQLYYLSLWFQNTLGPGPSL